MYNKQPNAQEKRWIKCWIPNFSRTESGALSIREKTYFAFSLEVCIKVYIVLKLRSFFFYFHFRSPTTGFVVRIGMCRTQYLSIVNIFALIKMQKANVCDDSSPSSSMAHASAASTKPNRKQSTCTQQNAERKKKYHKTKDG